MTQIEPIYYSSLHGLYDLATQPETAGELRAEIWPIVSDNNGFMTHKALYDMKLTDNFMKQCQRLSPPTFGKHRHQNSSSERG